MNTYIGMLLVGLKDLFIKFMVSTTKKVWNFCITAVIIDINAELANSINTLTNFALYIQF